MKRISLCFISTIILLFVAGCNNNEHTTEQSIPTTQHNTNINNTSIDTSSIVKIEEAGCISVSTDSIKSVLEETGRFEITEIPHQNCIDVFCNLDKVDDYSIASVNFTISEDNTTTMISYNFLKETVQGQSESSVRWGLDILLQILGDSLTDDTWNDIVSMAEKNEVVGALGTDYAGYSNANTGIKLIYVDLGNNVQIDIVPYE